MTELEKAIKWFENEAKSGLIRKLVADRLVDEDVIIKLYRQYCKETHVYCSNCHTNISDEEQFEIYENIFCDDCEKHGDPCDRCEDKSDCASCEHY